MDLIKLKGIKEWPVPKTPKNVQQLVRFCNFYWKFIINYATIAQPLNLLMRKTTKFEWNNKAQLAFEKLKQQFLE
jgi:hypothetical protein